MIFQMRGRVILLIGSNVSEKRAASFFRVIYKQPSVEKSGSDIAKEQWPQLQASEDNILHIELR
jgi:hypothetical protein